MLATDTASDRGSAASAIGWVTSTVRRLVARRRLLLTAVIVFGALVTLAELPVGLAMAGLVALTVSAALLPRRGLVQAVDTLETDLPAAAPADHSIRDVLDALPDPAILLDLNGGIVHCNRRAVDQYTGIESARHLSSILRHPELLDAMTAVPRHGEPVTVTFAERVPLERRTAATLALLGDDARRAPDGAAMLLCLRDLTEQERINQMRADFIANASHELRTPLASVLGFVETLQGSARDDPEARERFLCIMAQQAERMSRLIDDLLSLSRVEMNAHLVPITNVDLGETVRYVVNTLHPLASESDITLELDMQADPSMVRGDRDELVQLLQNLIQNGIKYGRKGGRVLVRMARPARRDFEPNRIAVSVTDDGPGIAPEHLPRLTERFYRVDVASSREKGGTGLGLAIAKHIVNRHRGELKIASEPGEGSTFTVLLDELPPDRIAGGARSSNDSAG